MANKFRVEVLDFQVLAEISEHRPVELNDGGEDSVRQVGLISSGWWFDNYW